MGGVILVTSMLTTFKNNVILNGFPLTISHCTLPLHCLEFYQAIVVLEMSGIHFPYNLIKTSLIYTLRKTQAPLV